jgi:hypothetical protein
MIAEQSGRSRSGREMWSKYRTEDSPKAVEMVRANLSKSHKPNGKKSKR